MTAIGETLRRERLRRNLDLEAVSHELKITPKMLEAIEEEKFDRLPGGVFAKAFVRQYARFLGLDDEEMGVEVQRMLQPTPEVPSLSGVPKSTPPPLPLPRVEAWDTIGDRRFRWSSPLPSLALVVVVMMGCAGVYSWWQRTRHAAATRPPRSVSAPAVIRPQQAAPPVAEPPAAAAPPVEQSQAAPTAAPANLPAAQAAPGAANEAGSNKAASEAPANPAASASPPATTPTGALPPQLPSNPNAAVRVEIVADEPVWVLARTDGKYLFSGTLEPNQTRTVEANNVIVLRLGNAGGVSLTLNGKPIGTVGPKGQVRTVQLTSGGFEIVAAPKPPGVPLEPL